MAKVRAKQQYIALTPAAKAALDRLRKLFGKGDAASAAIVAFEELPDDAKVDAVRRAKEIETPEPVAAAG